MADLRTDVIIFGAGIAGLWTFHQLKSKGYDVLLLEKDSIGSGQTVASQGIIHSGLKFTVTGTVNKLAAAISQTLDQWRDALKGVGAVDLSSVQVLAESQYLLIPKGVMSGVLKVASKKMLGNAVLECDTPDDIRDSGFRGSVIQMQEPVLDVPSLLSGLADPYKGSIRKIDWPDGVKIVQEDNGDIAYIQIKDHKIFAQQYVFTAAGGNGEIARQTKQNKKFELQRRSLVQAMVLDAPYDLYGHCIQASHKPAATITTHRTQQGERVWYVGASVAEKPLNENPAHVYKETRSVFQSYFPNIDVSNLSWATWPIDRVEGKAMVKGWMPDTPTLHSVGNAVYALPTKLTFAPMLGDMIEKHIIDRGGVASCKVSDWRDLSDVEYALPPWERVTWKKESSDKLAS